jgi:hypothetical protein
MYHYPATWDFPYTVGCMRGMYKMSLKSAGFMTCLFVSREIQSSHD